MENEAKAHEAVKSPPELALSDVITSTLPSGYTNVASVSAKLLIASLISSSVILKNAVESASATPLVGVRIDTDV